ncbi:MAG: cupin domain-containing protein [Verrucomicrobiae bacterium]|nr:cupin domain-containing protein [Verrucomicrobiae bacterium]
MKKLAITRINSNGPEGIGLQDINSESKEIAVAGEKFETGYNYFIDDSGQFTAGVWECTPCTLLMDNYPVDEVCYLLSGIVKISDREGNTEIFHSGDCFAIPKGFYGTWENVETSRNIM